MKLIYICLGGALGTGLRYLVSNWALRLFGTSLPFGTLVVNVLGSFFISLLMCIGLNTQVISPTVRTVLTIGFLGGFTTYSSFNYETLSYFQDGEVAKGILSVFIMLFACAIAGMAGVSVAKLALNFSN